MNSFQEKTIQKIEILASQLGLEFIRSEPSKSGRYEAGKIAGFQIWIYEDGADFISEFYDRRFEAPDFKDQDQLIEHLISSLRDGVVNLEQFQAHPRKDLSPLFNRAISALRKFIVR